MAGFIHLMIDLETMGTRYDAPILAIGAIFFDPATSERGDQFYVAIDPADALRWGTLEGSTLKWWMQQGDQARGAAMAGRALLSHALYDFSQFIQHACDRGRNGVRVWGNGATFDISILEYAYGRVDQAVPWRYSNVRDCRTIKDLADGLCELPPRAESSTAHDALDDAIYQAGWVSTLWNALRPTITPIAQAAS